MTAAWRRPGASEGHPVGEVENGVPRDVHDLALHRPVAARPTRRPVLIVDDDPEARAGVARLVEQLGCETREAGTGEEALETARRELPGLVVLEVRLPDISGYTVCRRLRDEFGEDLPIVFVSGVRTESFDRVAGFLVGADDYLVKPFAADEFLARVHRLMRHHLPVMPALASKLTSRELEVLRLLAEGLSQKEIATRLFLSPKTVGTHIERIYRKLGVRTRAEAVALAHREHLVAS